MRGLAFSFFREIKNKIVNNIFLKSPLNEALEISSKYLMRYLDREKLIVFIWM